VRGRQPHRARVFIFIIVFKLVEHELGVIGVFRVFDIVRVIGLLRVFRILGVLGVVRIV